MIKWLKNKWQRHNDRLALRNAFEIARTTYPHISYKNRIILSDTLQDMVDEYCITWGVKDHVAKVYYERLLYFIRLYHGQEEK